MEQFGSNIKFNCHQPPAAEDFDWLESDTEEQTTEFDMKYEISPRGTNVLCCLYEGGYVIGHLCLLVFLQNNLKSLWIEFDKASINVLHGTSDR